MTMGVSLWHWRNGIWHVSQTIMGTYEDGAMRIDTANVMEFVPQNSFELKCRGAATLGRRRNLL